MSWLPLPSTQPGDMMEYTLLNKFRDNLLESFPGIASGPGLIFATGPGALDEILFSGNAGKLVRVDDDELGVSFDGYGFLQSPLYESNDLTGDDFPATTADDVVTQAITTTGGDVLIIATFEAQETKSANVVADHTFILRRDTTDLWTVQLKNSLFTGIISQKVTFFWLDSPGAAATYTYKLRGAYVPASTTGDPQCWGRMSLFELPS
jgi:hypothetical protein